MEGDAFAEMKDVGEGSRRVPGSGEVGVEIHFGVAFDEAVKEQSGEALGLGIGAEAGSRLAGLDSMTKTTEEGSDGGWEQGERKKSEEKRDKKETGERI